MIELMFLSSSTPHSKHALYSYYHEISILVFTNTIFICFHNKNNCSRIISRTISLSSFNSTYLSALTGHNLNSVQSMHSVPFALFLELSVISTSIAPLHLPHDMHLSSHLIRTSINYRFHEYRWFIRMYLQMPSVILNANAIPIPTVI